MSLDSGTRSGPFGLETTLPTFWYQREDVYALEQEHIFFREGFCVGRQEDVPRPGDHRVIDVCGQSIILVRNPEAVLRAFYNVCRHRGARLCSPTDATDTPPGLAVKGGVANGMILCPYHAWAYDLNGQLLRAPHLAKGSGFIDCHFLFGPTEMARSHFDPSDAVDFWHLVNQQDWKICELVQAGIGARVHEVGACSLRWKTGIWIFAAT